MHPSKLYAGEAVKHAEKRIAQTVHQTTLTDEFRVDGVGEISWWILGYGDQVEVLAPAALRKRIAKTAQRMVELNNKVD